MTKRPLSADPSTGGIRSTVNKESLQTCISALCYYNLKQHQYEYTETFNDACNSLHYYHRAPSGRTISECGGKWLCPHLKYYSSLWLVVPRKTTTVSVLAEIWSRNFPNVNQVCFASCNAEQECDDIILLGYLPGDVC
jgi:hypothetical protein